MNLTRATAALFTAISIIIGPALAADSLTPRAKRTTINYGSGTWGGPLTGPTQTGNPTTADVALYGNSIANRCTPAVRAALAAKGLTLYTWTWSGQNTRGIVDGIQAAPVLAPTVIVEAGTNDVFNPYVAAEITRGAGYLDAAVPRWRWVDTYVGRTSTLADDLRNSGQVNGLIHGIAGEERIVRWVDALTAARGRGRPLSYYLQDGVHPWVSAGTGHGDGCAFFAAVVAGAVPGAPQ